MAEDAIDLDVNDFQEEAPAVVEQETTPKESSPKETKETPEVVDDGFDTPKESKDSKEDKPEPKSKKETEDKPKEEAEAPQEEAEEEPEQVEETDKEDKPRAKNSAQERIRTLANDNRALRQQVEQLNAQVYQPQTVQELVEAGESEAMAEAKALRQEIEYERFNRQVTELNHSIESESNKVLQDFPVFNPESDQYNKDLAERVGQLYSQTAGIQTDPNTGLAIQANVLPYDFYKTFAETIEQTTQKGEATGQKNAEKQLSAVEQPSSQAPRKPEKSAFEKGLDAIWKDQSQALTLKETIQWHKTQLLNTVARSPNALA